MTDKSLSGGLPSLTRLPYNEFSVDLEYQASMDEAWHNWLQPKWDKERSEWLKKQNENSPNC